MKGMTRMLLGTLLALSVTLAGGTAAGAGGVDGRAPRTFTGTGSLGEYYTVQTVNGTLMTLKPIPTDVTVLNWQGLVQVTAPLPRLHRNFQGGYWKQTYHLNAWYLGRNSGSSYHLLLPDTILGGTFTGMLMTEISVGGNWQNWMDFTAG
jgi:hypothetical protein